MRCSFTQLVQQCFCSLPATRVGPVYQLCLCPQRWSELEPTQVGSPAPRAPICPAVLSNTQLCTPRDSGTEGEGPAVVVTAQVWPPDAQTPAGMEPWARSREQPSRGPEALHTAQAHSRGSPLASGPQVKGLEPPGEGLVQARPLSMPQCGVCKKPQ